MYTSSSRSAGRATSRKLATHSLQLIQRVEQLRTSLAVFVEFLQPEITVQNSQHRLEGFDDLTEVLMEYRW